MTESRRSANTALALAAFGVGAIASCSAAPKAPPAAPEVVVAVAVAEEPDPDSEPPANAERAPEPPARIAPGQIWMGRYLCRQGWTAMALVVVTTRGNSVEAIFEFEHAETSAAGAFRMSGTFDPDTRELRFVAGEWMEQPDGYVTVGMSGALTEDGRRYEGRIDDPGCGEFSVELQESGRARP